MKKHTCRWWDCHMDCCRHPKYYEQMRIRGVFFEPICDEKSDRCEYEKIDGEVLATILGSLNELEYNTSVEIDSENGCLVIKENE